MRYIFSAPPSADAALRVHGKVAREMGMAIVAGRYRPGEILHGEVEASERLRVSRTAYREAIRILVAKGLIEARPKIGTRVSARETWHLLDPDVLRWIFEAGPDQDMIDQLFELRRVIEPEAAALAATRRDDAQIAAMRRALAAMAEHSLLTEEGKQADQEFHAVLLSASRNAFLISLTNGVSAAVSLTTAFKQKITKRYRDPIPDHARVLDAIARQEASGAREAMADLIDQALADARSIVTGHTKSNTPT